MKRINELTNLKTYKPETERPQDLTRPMKVWVQLADMFGKSFHREHGEKPGELWKQAVWRLTDVQIASGLANLGNDDLAFAPNCSQFVAACKRKPVKVDWVKTTAIEDKREPGKMPFAEWKESNA